MRKEKGPPIWAALVLRGGFCAIGGTPGGASTGGGRGHRAAMDVHYAAAAVAGDGSAAELDEGQVSQADAEAGVTSDGRLHNGAAVAHENAASAVAGD